MKKILIAILLTALIGGATFAPAATVGPDNGTLIIVGGGDKTSIWPTFLDLIGGKDAPIVIIPTANEKGEENTKDQEELAGLGATNIKILHTTDRNVANSAAFVEPLRTAKGVWISGGRQWRLVDAYLDTRTQREIEAVLARGGVVGGSSAGASIQASYLVRGAKAGNKVLMAPGYEKGFGLVKNSAIDQHINTRGRSDSLREVLAIHPGLLGIGLDEATALVVKGDVADVIGAGVARFASRSTGAYSHVELTSGGRYDLAKRQVIPAQQPAAASGTTAAVAGPVRVAIYSDEGSPKAPDLIEACLTPEPEGFVFKRVSAEEIRAGVLKDYAVLAEGGGRASLQAEALGDAGREKIREFVRNGGGYIGICAGAYLAAADRPYYLRLVNAKVVDREHWARGGGNVQIRFTEEGRKLLNEPSQTVQIRYNQGPLLARDSQTDLPSYTELAVFETEIAEKGAPRGVMKGTSAMVNAPFGKGRVFISSPHPERTEGLDHIIRAAIRWAAGVPISANPAP